MTTERRKKLALLAGAGVAVVAFVLIRRRSSDAGYAGIPVGPVESHPTDGPGADAGTGGGAAVDTSAVDDLAGQLSDFVGLTEDREQQLAANQGELEQALQSISDSLSSGAYDTGGGSSGWFDPQIVDTPGGTVVIGPDGSVTVVPHGPTVQGPSGQVPAGPNAFAGGLRAQLARGRANIVWANQLYFAGQGDLFVWEQLHPVGVNPQTWARRHPAAARLLGVPLTRPAPKRAPVRIPKASVSSKPGPRARASSQPQRRTQSVVQPSGPSYSQVAYQVTRKTAELPALKLRQLE